MSLWNPDAEKRKNSLTVQFNTEVSAKAYSNARDEVLLMKGVTKTGENQKARTMTVDVKDTGLQSKIEDVAGVESVRRTSPPGGYSHHRL